MEEQQQQQQQQHIVNQMLHTTNLSSEQASQPLLQEGTETQLGNISGEIAHSTNNTFAVQEVVGQNSIAIVWNFDYYLKLQQQLLVHSCLVQ